MNLFFKKVCTHFLLIIAIITLIGCSKTSLKSNTLELKPTPILSLSPNNKTPVISIESQNDDLKIEVDGIYEMDIIGEKPSLISLSSVDRKNIRANIGIIRKDNENKYCFLTRLNYTIDSISGFDINSDNSIINNDILSNYNINNSPEKLNIEELTVIFYKEPNIETTPNVIAYSKVIDPNNKVNNIRQVRFNGVASKNDLIADIVALIKKDNSYKLLSNSMTYEIVGDIPEGLEKFAIENSNADFASVDLNHIFVVYMSIYKHNKYNNIIGVKIETYSPFKLNNN